MKRWRSFAASIAFCCAASASQAVAQNCSFINGVILEGKAQSLPMLESVRDPLSCIVPQIPEFEFQIRNNERNTAAIGAYLSLTAAAILLVEDEFINVTRFRELDSAEVAQVLAIGAGHKDRSVRVNSARLLASVVDNSTLCIVLDHLHQPVPPQEGGVAVNARANLLGIARAAASWISIENQTALAATLSYTFRTISQEAGGDLSKTRELVTDIERRLRANESGFALQGELDDCLDPSLYRYWIPQNFQDQFTNMNPNPFLAGLESPVLETEVVDIRYCYQEFRGDSGNDSYLVACHTSPIFCEQAKENPQTQSSECVPLDMETTSWAPGTDGLFGSLYQYSATEFPAPFPAVPDEF
ncbi:hypothetical protein KUV51_08895 [Tateyamaria omphalii]|uniref:hypothetical protein n=1 Tax=Tateyamaria omphalii TaxID=299262 RepID=UPI001C994977|nr:hypothetical protein [Tateyamaria omphalii]MBY5933110.1 hypothetical protein [Tateyamaria omphalii]